MRGERERETLRGREWERHWESERARERVRERERDTERESERHTERVREREREIHTERVREKVREWEWERERERHSEKERKRERHRGRERERERERERWPLRVWISIPASAHHYKQWRFEFSYLNSHFTPSLLINMKVWAALTTSFCPPKSISISQTKITWIKIIKMNKYEWELITIIVQFIPIIRNSVLYGINKVNISLILIIIN